MAMINYADKVALNSNSNIADINKVNATDMNELKNAFNNQVAQGWYKTGINPTFTFVSYDSETRTGVVSSNLDMTPYLNVGMKVKFTQNSAIKYAFITAITSNSITLFLGTDYSINSSAISNTYYSMLKAPFGFPTSPTKWSIVIRPALSQANATLNTYYSSATTLVLPIGAFNISWSGVATLTGGAAAQVSAKYSLSTSTTSETDSDFSSPITGYVYTATAAISSSISKAKTLVIASKTTYYLVGVVTQKAETTGLYAGNYISATCAYL